MDNAPAWAQAFFALVLVGVTSYQIILARRALRGLERPRVLAIPYQAISHDTPNLFGVKFWYECLNVGRAPAILNSVEWKFYLDGEPINGVVDLGELQKDSTATILGITDSNNKHSRDEYGAVSAITFDRDRCWEQFTQRRSSLILSIVIEYDDAAIESHVSSQGFRFNFSSRAWERLTSPEYSHYT